MKQVLPFIFGACVMVTVQMKAQSVTQGWGGKIGGTGADVAYAIAADGSGNTFVTGSFNGSTVSFSPIGSTSPSTTLTSSGVDAFW